MPGPYPRIAAVILAGGFGTRLRSVLPDLPKPMAPVADRPFVEWAIRYLARQGIGRAILSTGYKAETIAQHFAQVAIGDVVIRCILEPQPLGTAGGFLHAVEGAVDLPDAWLVLNGDSLTLIDLAPFFALLDDPAVDGAVAALWMDDAARYGSLAFDSQGRLREFLEKRPGSSWINAGIYLIRQRVLERFPQKLPLSWETDVFPELLRQGARIQVHQARGAFLDIGLPESLAQAGAFIRENSSEFLQS